MCVKISKIQEYENNRGQTNNYINTKLGNILKKISLFCS